MTTALLAAVLWATPGSGVRLAQGQINLVEVDEKKGAFFISHLNQQLALEPGLSITTPDELNAVLGLERQKALLGCAEESCSAEFAGALGADGILTGTIARVGSSYTVNLKVVRARDAQKVSVVSARAANEDELLAVLERAAKTIGAEVEETLVPAAADTPGVGRASRTGAARLWWVPVAAGGACLVTGGVLYGLAKGAEGRLRSGDPTVRTREDLEGVASAGRTQEALGFTLGAVAFAAIGVGIVWRLVGADAPAATAWAAPGAAGVVLAGSLP